MAKDKESNNNILLSLAWGALGAGAIFLAVLAAGSLGGFVKMPLLYHSLVFGTFFGLYMMMPGGFSKNFNVPTKTKMGIADILYYTMVVHSTCGFGDMYPLTFYARSCVTTHLGLVFLGVANLIPMLNGGN